MKSRQQTKNMKHASLDMNFICKPVGFHWCIYGEPNVQLDIQLSPTYKAIDPWEWKLWAY